MTIDAMTEIFGEQRKVVLARELTKLYEQVFRGELAQLQEWISADPMHKKGEFVLMVEGYPKETETDRLKGSTEDLLKILVEELPVKQAAKIASQITGKKKNELYKEAMKFKM